MAAPVHNATVVRDFGEDPSGFHCGRDYRADRGTAVRATLGGVVVRIGADGGGCLVVVESNAIRHLYRHLFEAQVRRGDTVETGDQLGIALGPHLHYEERVTPYRPGDRRSPRFDLHPNTRLPG